MRLERAESMALAAMRVAFPANALQGERLLSTTGQHQLRELRAWGRVPLAA
jgi:hypothetical protein